MQLKTKKLKLLFLFVILLFIFSACNSGPTKYEIINGKADLREVNLDNEIIELVGVVDFIWKDFALNHDYSTAIKDTIRIENSWNNQPTGYTNYPMYGYATYHFSIKISDQYIGKDFILRPNHFIAYASEIYVNGKIVSNNGSVGKSKNDEAYSPSGKTSAYSFRADSNTLNVNILASNHNHFRGGISEPISFGLEINQANNREKDITFNLVIIISLMIMFLYHFIFFIVFRFNKTPLYFAISCLVYAIYLSMQGSMCFFLFFPSSTFQVHSFIHLAMPFLLPSSFMFFFYSIFPKIVSKRVRNATAIITILLISFLLFNNSSLNSYIVELHNYYLLLIILYIYFAAIKAVIKKNEGAILFLSAYIIFSMCAINDLLNMFELINTVNLISTGMVVFVVLLSIMQGYSSLKMHNQITTLSSNLKSLNESIETKIEHKTKELNQSLKKEKDFKLFLQDMTNSIVHDLNNSLSLIINIKQYIKVDPSLDSIQEAGYEIKNLAKDILNLFKYDNTLFELNIAEKDIMELINESLVQVDSMAREKNVSFSIDESIKCIIKLDTDIIERTIVNLLINATEFSPTNGVIRIELKNNDNEIQLSIFSSGPHIPPEQQEIIFERFLHPNIKVKSITKSAGLRLAYCKMAIEGHNGKIGLTSQSDSELEFWFTLPNLVLFKKIEAKRTETTSSSYELTNSDRLLLMDYANRLSKFEIYDASAISQYISEIEVQNERIENWINELRQSLFQLDELKYRTLLKQVLG